MSAQTIQILALPLIAWALCGLILSAAVNLLALTGLQPNGVVLLFGLAFGIFPLWFVVVAITRKLTRGVVQSKKDGLKTMLSGCPAWMIYVTKVLEAYTWVSFLAALAAFALSPPGRNTGTAPRVLWVLFSSGYMLFYFVGLSTVITAYRRGVDIDRRCPNGHIVGVDDRFCATCGAAL
jgi:hypothetical protein